MFEESKEQDEKSFQVKYYTKFKAPTKSFSAICDIFLMKKLDFDNNYINNLTSYGIDYSDPKVNEFFTSPDYLAVVQLLNDYSQIVGAKRVLSEFILSTVKDSNQKKEVLRTIVCMFPFMFAIENPEL